MLLLTNSNIAYFSSAHGAPSMSHLIDVVPNRINCSSSGLCVIRFRPLADGCKLSAGYLWTSTSAGDHSTTAILVCANGWLWSVVTWMFFYLFLFFGRVVQLVSRCLNFCQKLVPPFITMRVLTCASPSLSVHVDVDFFSLHTR